MSKAILILYLFLSNFSYSAVAPKDIKADLRKISQLRDSIAGQSTKITRLRASIRQLEKKLGSNNSDYLRSLEQKKEINKKLILFQNTLNTNEDKIRDQYLKTTKIIKHYLLYTFDDDLTGVELAQQKLLKSLLSEKFSGLLALMKRNNKLRRDLAVLEADFSKYSDIESSLNQLIEGLEKKKQNLAANYLEEVKRQNQLGSELEEVEKQRKKIYHAGHAVNSIAGVRYDLLTPLGKYTKRNKTKKGVYFKYDQNVPLLAPAEGRIVYVGSLSNLGNVIMIEHADNFRSVLLGQFKYKVKKGQKVQKGESIGKTTKSPGKDSKIYYELRNNNKVHKNIDWQNS